MEGVQNKKPYSLKTLKQKEKELKKLGSYLKLVLFPIIIYFILAIIFSNKSLFLPVGIPLFLISILFYIIFAINIWEVQFACKRYITGLASITNIGFLLIFYFMEYRLFLKGEKTIEELVRK